MNSLFETQHQTTMIGLVEAGLGIAVVTSSMAMPRRDHPLLVSVPLDNPVISRVVGLIKQEREANRGGCTRALRNIPRVDNVSSKDWLIFVSFLADAE